MPRPASGMPFGRITPKAGLDRFESYLRSQPLPWPSTTSPPSARMYSTVPFAHSKLAALWGWPAYPDNGCDFASLEWWRSGQPLPERSRNINGGAGRVLANTHIARRTLCAASAIAPREASDYVTRVRRDDPDARSVSSPSTSGRGLDNQQSVDALGMERFEALRCPYFKLGHVGTANETLHLTGVDNTVDLSVAHRNAS